jgi:hypothetical protein
VCDELKRKGEGSVWLMVIYSNCCDLSPPKFGKWISITSISSTTTDFLMSNLNEKKIK